MKALSLDIRRRVVRALKTETSSLRVAARFDVSPSFVRKLRMKVNATGDPAPRPIPGKERLVQGETEAALRRLVAEMPDATLLDLCALLSDETGVVVSETTMWRQLQRMGITLKKRPSTRARGSART